MIKYTVKYHDLFFFFKTFIYGVICGYIFVDEPNKLYVGMLMPYFILMTIVEFHSIVCLNGLDDNWTITESERF